MDKQKVFNLISELEAHLYYWEDETPEANELHKMAQALLIKYAAYTGCKNE